MPVDQNGRETSLEGAGPPASGVESKTVSKPKTVPKPKAAPKTGGKKK